MAGSQEPGRASIVLEVQFPFQLKKTLFTIRVLIAQSNTCNISLAKVC